MSSVCECDGFDPECDWHGTLEPVGSLSAHMTVEETKKKIERASQLSDILNDIRVEVARAMAKYPPFNSAHEGYSVLFEEVDELWEEVRAKQGERNLEDMRTEAIQIAAMAVRFALDICNPDKVQK